MRIRIEFCLPCLLLFASLVCLRAEGPGTQLANQDGELGGLVETLNHDSYQTRQRAKRELLAAAAKDADAVALAIEKGLGHRSLEVRAACQEALLEIKQFQSDSQIERLLNPTSDADQIHLPSWKNFSEHAGTDMPARRLYSRVFAKYPQALQSLEDTSVDREKVIVALVKKFDPYRLQPDDSIGWAMVLMLDIEDPPGIESGLTSRLSMALSQSSMGPRLESKLDKEVVRRLIEGWILAHPDDCSSRERLLASMRYQCRVLVSELCDGVFQDPQSPAATQVTALLCAAAIGRNDIELQARNKLQDERTAHVWQLIAARKTKIRTQVRDVALALLLQHHGIDPRKAGFTELQADPLLVFRDHSLGFADEEARQRALTEAFRLLESR